MEVACEWGERDIKMWTIVHRFFNHRGRIRVRHPTPIPGRPLNEEPGGDHGVQRTGHWPLGRHPVACRAGGDGAHGGGGSSM